MAAINVGEGSNIWSAKKSVTVREPKGAAVTMEEGTYTIRSALDQSKALDVANASKDNVANVMLHTWNGGDNQKFTLKAAGDGSYYIIAKHSNKAVEVTNAALNTGANVAQYTQNQSVAQRWFFDRNSDGTYTMRQANSGMALDVTNAKTANGTNIQQCTRNGSAAQKFYLAPVDASKWSLLVARVPDLSAGWVNVRYKSRLTASAGGVGMTEGSDYSVAYKTDLSTGTKVATVVGKGGFTGSQSVDFEKGHKVEVKLSSTTFPYDGAAKMSTIWVYVDSVQLPWSAYDVRYVDNVLPGTGYGVAVGKGDYTGEARAPIVITAAGELEPEPGSGSGAGPDPDSDPQPAPAAGKVAMFRLFNPYTGEHFYTASDGERSTLVSAGWQYEGIGWTAPASSGTPVYRMCNIANGDHHYTIHASERDGLRLKGWRYEGIGWYSDDAHAVTLFRLYNPRATGAGSHHYTTSTAERDKLLREGWRNEGVGWYGV